MFGNTFRATTPIPEVAIAEEVEQLRQATTQTAADIIDGVQNQFVTNEQFHQQFGHLDSRINELLSAIQNINQRMDANSTENQGYERFDTPKPPEDQEPILEAATSDTHYDLDHDVVMRTKNYSAPLHQVPEPGFFSGKTSETDLFCQLCEDTFKTSPYKYVSEETKINFVKSRLRDSARNWYLTKYKDNIVTRYREVSKFVNNNTKIIESIFNAVFKYQTKRHNLPATDVEFEFKIVDQDSYKNELK